ncbi:MAG TPA: non-ribosomal peptide synthase/polyketide synthase [Chitinophaga sp.]|uniref:non-ribosomal peptide synthase/polyketide synthase n=1 Tax=Chitinophaga sp. TaxID=1869181 RepID=UPI002B53C8A6|nr:non-ribosomal peptide synthase/polyketide synthase [Chitinophaga sp.]HVI44818.1 non-ribosomal peptide synthase/polyketide synthase [Chitinophaga sp.]
MTGFNLIDIVNLLEKANDKGIHISFDDNELIVQARKEKVIDTTFLAELKSNKEYLIEYFKRRQQGTLEMAEASEISIARRDPSVRIPLSYSQERLWFIDKLEGSVQYHLPVILRIKGELSTQALVFALQQMVNRHEVLRTVIEEDNGKPSQRILDKDQWQLEYIDEALYKEDMAALHSRIKALIAAPFDLAADHMMRAHLITQHNNEHVLVVTVHHIASDGWSTGIVVNELVELYTAFTEERAPQLPQLQLQYADYATWQRDYLSGDVLRQQIGYWKKKLTGVDALNLPLDYPRPAVQSTRGAARAFNIGKELTAKLQALSRQQDTTLYMTLLAVFNVLLYRYSNQEDISVGTPAAGRNRQELEGLIGFFVNTLVLRNDLSGDPAFIQLLQQVKETTLNAYDHQEVPFERIVEAVVKQRDLSRNPLFQVMFMMQNMPAEPELSLHAVSFTQEGIASSTTMFDLMFSIEEQKGELTGSVSWCADLFSAATIDRMITHFEQLLSAVTITPAAHISTLEMLTEDEKLQLIHDFNHTAADFPQGHTAPDLFDAQAARTPDEVALLLEGTHLTYRDLQDKSNQLAHFLQSKGTGAETLIPLCMERSLEMIIAIWGILKAGAAYVPVDPEYPAERISYILQDTQASLVISSRTCKDKLTATSTVEVITLDDAPEVNAMPVVSPGIVVQPDQLAYVIYTSGSTGQPKGVMVAHRSLVNLVQGQRIALQLKPGMRALQFASLSFDVSCAEIFNTLLSGGTLVLPRKDDLLSAAGFAALTDRYGVEILYLPPSYLHMVKDVLGPVKTIVCAGEAMIAEDAKYVMAKGIRMVNAYGPTENTVYTTITDQPLLENGAVVIGRPVANVQVYILDSHRNVCPVGIAGEICAGGAGLARGYFNKTGLTAEKFITDPFSSQPGARLYRTGDLGRWLPDGTIEYLGRMDNQVKIRGFRIELGEIETVLQQCTLVDEAVVLAKTDHNNTHHKRLVGYIVPSGEFDREGIMAWLRQKLPDYMLPALLIPMDKFPLNTSGKVDRKALPEPDATTLLTNEFIAPRNTTEETLASIWQELLGVSRIGIYDNFFELGGDSIITIQVVSRAKRAGYELQPRDLFQHQTLAALSALLASRTDAVSTAEQGRLTGNSGLLPIQQWFFETKGAATIPFNQSILLAIDKSVTPSALAAAIRHLVDYHDALRFTYSQDNNGWRQSYGDAEGTLEITDLRGATEAILPETIAQYANQYQQSLRIEQGILIRPVLFLTPDTDKQNRLLLVIHHLGVDGVSWRILLEDLELLLKSNGESDTVSILGKKSSSYRQWYAALTEYGQRRRVQAQLDYWQQTVNSYRPLRTDIAYDGALTVSDTASHRRRLGVTQTQRLLQEAPRAYHTVINDVLLCALTLALTAWNNARGAIIGLEGHGREDIAPGTDTSRTIGWFTNMYPVRLHTAAGSTPGNALRDVKEQLRRMPDKGLGYGVLKYINRAEGLQGKDPWDILFNYLGQSDNTVKQDGLLGMAAESSGTDAGADFPMRHKLALTGMVQDGELMLQWEYSNKHYAPETVAELADAYMTQLEKLIDHCAEQAATPVSTPSDYGLGAEVTNEELDAFLDAAYNGVPRRSQVSSLYRLSGLQEGMLFHNLYDTEGGTYVEQFSCDLKGVQEELFRQSWNHIAKQYSVLRTAFHYDALPIPVQCVYNEVEVPMYVIDLRHLKGATQEEAIAVFREEDGRRRFNLEEAPLMRISLLRLNEDTYRMFWTSHHILFDGWSLPLMVENLLHTYEGLVTGKQPVAGEEDRFGDYIRYLERRDKEQEEQYWRSYLQTLPEGSLLPFITATDKLTKGGGEFREYVHKLDAATTALLTRFAQRHHLTQNTLMQGVWAYLLYRYSGRREVAYGVTVSGRPEDLAGMEKKVGLFINTVPLHTVIDPAAEIIPWLQSLQNNQLQNREYQYTGLNEIQRWTNIEGELFDSTITFQNYPIDRVVDAQEWSLQVSGVETHPHTNYPLTIIMGIHQETTFIFTYNSTLPATSYIERIAQHFGQVVSNIIHQSTGIIGDIDLLTPAEHDELEVTFNNCNITYPRDQSFIHLFEAQAVLTPDAPAIVFENRQLSYRELNDQANRVAHALQARGVTTGTWVPLCTERSPEMITGILGILKAGGAYVPMEPDFPAERIKYMLEDTRAEIMVCTAAVKAVLPVDKNVKVLLLDDDKAISNYPAVPPSRKPLQEEPLYVIYTSGSTGTPKGVIITHGNLADYLAGLKANTPVAGCLSFGLVSSIATDLGNTVLYGALAQGSTLHLFSKNAINDAEAMYTYFEKNEIDCIKIVPSHWKALSEPGKLLLPRKLLIFGGEALEAAVVNNIRETDTVCTVINHYGPTETTIGKLLHIVDPQRVYDRVIPIGKPFSNTRVYVLNEEGRQCPVGVPGELYIGGDGVAAGYLNNTALTDSKFIADRFSGAASARLYRTGDLVRYLSDGNIVFMGRVDDQVKIRGYRVEPGEISRVLAAHPDVSQAIVVAREDSNGNKRLIGYIVPEQSYDRDHVITYLESQLPDYMVPALLVTVERFPMLPNGKIDRKALPDPEPVVTNVEGYTEPQTLLEKQLAAIWSQLLDVEQIGRHDDFFALGGDSLLAIRVISATRKQLGVEVTIGDVFDHPTVFSLAQQLAGKSAPGSIPPLVRKERPANIPLSYSQERLWFIDQLEGSTHYHIPTVLFLEGTLNVTALSHALQTIVNRHESLRTVIRPEEGEAYQQVLPSGQWRMQVSEHPEYLTDKTALKQHIHQLLNEPFDLTRDHMLRVHLLTIGKNNYILVAVLHHIASDGWSSGILVRELLTLYNAYQPGVTADLSPLDIQYADYAIWQRSYLSGKVLEDKIAYWKDKLQGVTALNMPADYPRPAVQSTRGAVFSFRMNEALLDKLHTLGQQEGTTLFMTLLAAFKVLLYRYSGQQDICIGSSIAGRTQQETEGLIGFFVNTLALRSHVNGPASFTSLLQQVKETTLHAYEHQDVPFEKVVEAVVKERDISRTPLFQVMFELQNIPDTPDLQLGEVSLKPAPADHSLSRFDMNISMQETSRGLSGYVEYCTDLFHEDTIRRLAENFEQLLWSVVNNPSQAVDTLRIVTPATVQQLLEEFNNTALPYPADKTLVALFEEQAAQQPGAAALKCGDQVIPYKELAERSDALALALRAKGVQEDTLVPLCTGRTVDMVIGILGIMKAGGAYVPLDPAYPGERIQYILQDCNAAIAVADEANRNRLSAYIEVIAPSGHPAAGTAAAFTPAPHHLSYVIYTSGSTGKPKGVMVEHSGMLNHLYAKINDLELDHGTVIAFTASYTFDISVWQLFAALLCGGTTVIYSDELILQPAALIDQVEADRVTILELVPSYLAALLQEETPASLPALRYLLVTGEAVTQQVLRLWFSHPRFGTIPVVNAYGPTEASDDICHYFMYNAPDCTNIPLGKPVQNLRIYVFDSSLQLCPLGVPGEICVSGIGVARGYLNRPELTAEKFISDPYSTERMYRTGDLGRWLPDGNLEYLGRIDEQVKIRGYRIELGEIESVLQQHEAIRQAVVLAKAAPNDPQGILRLTAYIVPETAVDKTIITAWLKERLPEYMVPSLLMELDQLPLTPNGKIDKKALPDPDASQFVSEYTAPRNATEEALAQIWQELLKIQQVGIYDNFFELGGHSLLAMRLMAAVKKQLGVVLPVRAIFAHPIIASLAAHIQESGTAGTALQTIGRQERPQHIPLSFNQERLWFVDQLEGSVHYHIPIILRLKGTLNIPALDAAFKYTVNRHEVLRTLIGQEDGRPYQRILPEDMFEMVMVEDETLKYDPSALQQQIAAWVSKPYDLANDHKLRAFLLSFSAAEHVLVVIVHHIAFDGLSSGILMRELVQAYNALAAGEQPSMEPLPLQYADFAIWQRAWLSGDLLESKLSWWKEKLQDVTPLNLPADFKQPAIQSMRGSRISTVTVDKQLLGQLHQLSQQQGATLYMTLLAAFKVLLYRYSGQTDIVVGSSSAGRQHHEIEGMIGFFINMLTLRNHLDDNPAFINLLQQVKQTTLEAFEHQDVPFEKIVEAVMKDREHGRKQLFNVMFVMPDKAGSNTIDMPGIDVFPENIPHNTSRFNLLFSIQETESGFNMVAEYSTDLFKEATILHMLRHYEQLLYAVAAAPSTGIDKLRIYDDKEQQQLLHTFGRSEVPYNRNKTFVDLFLEQAALTPDARAVVTEDAYLTYKELDEDSNQLADYLRSKGVKAGSLVPLCIPRSVNMITGMLGILKAGAAYVPIEPDFPADRISYMLADVKATVVVASSESAAVLPLTAGQDIVLVDDENLILRSAGCPEHLPSAEDLAYIIYTSGSTGNPKGVMVTHHNLADYLAGLAAHTPVNSCSTFGLLSSIATDLGNTVLFTALINGAALHVFSKAAVNDAAQALSYIETHHIDCIKIVPSHWKALSDQDRLLLPRKLLIFGGEALEAAVVDNIRKSGEGCTVVNHYGPTETTIGKLLHVVNNGNGYTDVIPIGRPFSNTVVYVVSPAGELCPAGIPGELYIGGEGLATGYLNNSALTAEKFISDPFTAGSAALLYRTGDLVKYLPDGNIVFMGRVDDQVKIRGYRVEPGEISRVLEKCDAVSQGVVIAGDDHSGNKRLVGYVVPAGDFDKTAIFNYLRAVLPDYMIPVALVELDHFPLLPNGKINRKALPDPDASATATAGYTAPSTPVEERLAEIWAALLEVEQVGIHDDFFALGGHSLLAIRVISAIRKQLGTEVSIGDIFDHPTVAALATRLSQRMMPAAPALVRAVRPAHIPLSYSQERLWFIDQLEGSVHYHVPRVLRLKGDLDMQAFERAMQTIVDRHEILRTIIEQEDGVPYQRIMQPGGWKLTVTDNPQLRADKTALEAYVHRLVDAPFNMAADYKLRAELILLDASEYMLVATLHHIASDGWSTGIIVRELVTLYNAYTLQQPVLLPALEIQYADYAIWQRNYLSGAVLEEKLDYWKNKLTGTSALNLPVDFPRPAVQSQQGASTTFSLDRNTCEQLQELSRQQGVTFFMTLLAAFKVLLYRYSGQDDICVGTPVAGRTQQEVENLIGFFINTLALRSDLGGNPSFATFLQQVRQTTLGAFEHQDVPFEKIVDAVVTERTLERSPLFQVMFSLENAPDTPDMTLGNVELLPAGTENTAATFDLTISLQESATGLHGSVAYCTDLFTEATIHRLIAHFKELVQSVIADPQQAIGTLRLLPDAETALLDAFTDNAAGYTEETFVALFEAQAKRTPHVTAVTSNGRSLTYEELNRESARLAHHLIAAGVKEDTLVPVCLERSADMVVAILAVLRAGGAFVPVDPAYPEERIRYMLTDAGGTIAVTEQRCAHLLAGVEQLIILEEVTGIVASSPLATPQPHHLAYVIYTSGSTGLPKGVMIEHRSLSNFLLSMKDILGTDAACSLLAVTTFCFDIAYLELFLPLLSGGRVMIASREAAADAFLLKEQLALLQPSYMQATPATWQMLTDAGWQNTEEVIILTGGEAIKPELKNKLVQLSDRKVWNVYGPTEATIWATVKELQLREKITIGRPLANTGIYILDKNGQPAPIGVAGELCITGVQLARGYHNRPELTAEKFIAHPFRENERLYFTGDLGRWLPNGDVECLGRADDQVKIRGYRIELGEIESVLLQSPEVKQAVVVGRADNNGSNRLIAYIVPDAAFSRETVIAHLQSRLPEYMVPAMIVTLEALPLTNNGKVNRKALPEPDADTLLNAEYVAPRNATEQVLADIFSSLLKVQRAGIHDDFFALGGHSLLAVRLVAAIRKELGTETAIRDVFRYPTIATLAMQLERHRTIAAAPALVPQQRPDYIPLSYSQERLWFIDQLEGTTHYHLPSVLRLKGTLNQAALLYALQTIVARHEVLRTVILQHNGRPYQRIKDGERWQLHIITDESLRESNAALQDYITALVQQPFDLSTDDMLRVHLIALDAAEHILVVTLHHIAADGWSTGIIVQEFTALYSAYAAGMQPQLPILPIQYADYAMWQRAYLSGALLDNKLAWWKNTLADTVPLDLPVDYIRPAMQSTRGAVLSFSLDSQLTAGILALNRQEGTTLFMTMLTAFNVLLYRYSGQDDICIGTPVAGRTHQEMENLVGFFINTLVLRNNINNSQSFLSLLQQVKQTTLDAYEHQDVPFERIVEAVVKDRDMSRSPLFQVMFTVQNVPGADDESDFGGLEISAERTVHTTAKWDLSLTIGETPQGLAGSVEYAADLFTESTIGRMLSHFKQLLRAIVNDANTAVGLLPIIGQEEKQKLISSFNDNATTWPQEATVVSLFRQQAAATPDATALVFNNRSLSYKALDERSEKLAGYLHNKGVTKGSLVPLCTERSPEMMVGILGIMKAGGAYVPVDPTYPAERISYMLNDINASLLVTTSTLMDQLPAEWYNEELILLDAMGEVFAAPHVSSVAVSVQPDDLAYIMYTSGSTGKPKGVMVTHSNIVSLVKDTNYASFDHTSVILSTASPSFDATTFEYWGALLNGGLLVLCDEKAMLDNTLLKQEINRQERISLWFITTAWFNQLVDTDTTIFERVNTVLTGGEKMSEDHMSRLKRACPDLSVVHVYGPTENTTFSLSYFIYGDTFRSAMPLGKPLSNRQVYVLDTKLQPVPVGVRGELYLSGSGLALGYHNKPELTAERFIANPFATQPGTLMYKTGDLGRWLPDGNIEYLGRIDDQVKIRGFRIEPGEIEAVLHQSTLITQAVVLVKNTAAGKQLVAYIVPTGTFDRNAITAYLKNRLPDYMIPAFLVEMDKLPVTANGKINRTALLQVETGNQSAAVYVAPRTRIEAALATIWSDLLDISQVGIYDNFFALGGHSLLTIRLIAAIRTNLGLELLVRDVYKHQDVASLAALLEKQQDEAGAGRYGLGRLLVQDELPGNGHIVLLNGSNNGKPLFLLPGAGGLCDAYTELGRAFDDTYACYSFQMQGVLEGETPDQDMNAIAIRHIQWIKAIQPEGPYRLAGHSFGAHAAYEVARQLEAAGDRVEVLFSLDMQASATPDEFNVDSMYSNMLAFFGQYQLISEPYPTWTEELKTAIAGMSVEEVMPFVIAFVTERLHGKQVPFLLRILSLSFSNVIAHQRYRATGTIDAPLVVMKAAENPTRKEDPYMGWRPFAGNIQTMPVAGDHLTMVDGANAETLAASITAILDTNNTNI